MLSIAKISAILLTLANGQAQPADPGLKPSLEQLASHADVVAIVRVEDTDYEYVRGFPKSGFALLRVLIAYKGTENGALLEVPEEGLEDLACYYPKLALTQVEGRRYLAFLKAKGKDSFGGEAPSCRLPVLVTANAGYALLHPAGVNIGDPETLVERLTFADPAAYVDASEYTAAQIDELETDFAAKRVPTDAFAPVGKTYVYTRGIRISKLRKLMGTGLTQPRDGS